MLRAQDVEFLTGVTGTIEGWLNDYAAKLTLALLNHQQSSGVRGPCCEIGVYGGKYLSILCYSAKTSGDDVVAIDPYEHFSPQQVTENLKGAYFDRISFVRGFSHNLTAVELADKLGAKARFTSLDGSHDAVDVIWDLELAHQNVHENGIVAVDDFLNTQCLGVVEAVVKFLERKPLLVPFLFTSNKLFMCPVRRVEHYRQIVIDLARSDLDDPCSKNLIDRFSANPKWAETELCGHRLLIA